MCKIIVSCLIKEREKPNQKKTKVVHLNSKSVKFEKVVGSLYKSNSFGLFEIIEIKGDNAYIKFLNTGYCTKLKTNRIKRKGTAVKDLFSPTLRGRGFLGGVLYKTSENGKRNKSYMDWTGMFNRCYDPTVHKTHKCYIGCSVCVEWFNFQTFAKWHSENYIEGYVLDKDKLVKGNKMYSPETCTYLPEKENSVEANARYWEFYNPQGDYIKIYNLRAYCRDSGLNRKELALVHKGVKVVYKGWKKF